MKTMKKLLSLVLALCLVLSMAATVSAAEELPFTDVSEADWSYEAIQYVYANGLMKGDSETTFSPADTADRAMMVTILHRVDGETEATTESKFADLEEDWYVEAVNWAAETGVVLGESETKFNPYGAIQREQLVTILYRYSNNMGYDTTAAADLSTFVDAADVNTWAEDAMAWAVAIGLVKGDDTNGVIKLDPKGNATREQLAAILQRFVDEGSVSNPIQMLETEVELTVAAGATVFAQGYFNGMDLSVNGTTGFVVSHNGTAVADTEGAAELALVSENPRMPTVFSITNNGDAEATYTVSVTYPVGSMMNPEALFGLDEIKASVAEGNDQGYYYSYTSRADGTLVLSAANFDADKFDVILTNNTSYAMNLMSESTDGTVSIAVAAGDTVTIQVVSVPDANWSYPAVEVSLSGSVQ